MSLSSSNPVPASRFNTTARGPADAARPFVAVKQTDRGSLTASDLKRLHQAAIKGLLTRFKILSLLDSSKQLDNAYTLVMMLAKIKKHLRAYNMHNVFYVVSPHPNQVSNPSTCIGVPRDLLAKYATILVADIVNSVSFYRTYGQDYNLQNLQWSQEFLSTCCSDKIRNRVNKKLLEISKLHQGGPVFLWHLLRVITTMTKTAATAFIARMTAMTLSSNQGENVDRAVSLLRGGLRRLADIN